MSIEQDQSRYLAAAHAMQTGVALDMEADPTAAAPKQLRVGVNSAHISVEALATLLIKKGLFTIEEYTEVNADAMEREVARYEARLNSERSGGPEIRLV